MIYRQLRRLAAVAGMLLMLVGCSSTVRTVTHVATWNGPQGPYLYIGYAENEDVSKLKRCTIEEDNSAVCVEEEEVNKLLVDE